MWMNIVYKNKKYELIWSLILITIGIIFSIVGYFLFPVVVVVLVIGSFLVLYGVINMIKSVK